MRLYLTSSVVTLLLVGAVVLVTRPYGPLIAGPVSVAAVPTVMFLAWGAWVYRSKEYYNANPKRLWLTFGVLLCAIGLATGLAGWLIL